MKDFDGASSLQWIDRNAFAVTGPQVKEVRAFNTQLKQSSLDEAVGLSNLLHLTVSNVAQCPPDELLKPCRCEHRQEEWQWVSARFTRIICGERREEDLESVYRQSPNRTEEQVGHSQMRRLQIFFERLSESLNRLNWQKRFDEFVLQNSPVPELPRNVFHDIIFYGIRIDNCPKLVTIHPMAFTITGPYVQELLIRRTKLANDRFRQRDTFNAITSLENLRALYLHYSGLMSIPHHAFRPLKGNFQRKLVKVSVRYQKADRTALRMVGSYAFYYLSNLKTIDLSMNSIVKIHKNAFSLKWPTSDVLEINLSGNNLTETSIDASAFLEAHRPVHVVLGQGVQGNPHLHHLNEDVFRLFLKENTRNKVRLQSSKNGKGLNRLSCDCKSRWMFDDVGRVKPGLEDIMCSSNVNTSWQCLPKCLVFGHDLLHCGSNESFSVRDVFNDLSERLLPHERHFKRFVLSNTAVETLPAQAFGAITFEHLELNGCTSLKHIDDQAFLNTEDKVQRVVVRQTSQLSTTKSSQLKFSMFKNLTHLDISFDGNYHLFNNTFDTQFKTNKTLYIRLNRDKINEQNVEMNAFNGAQRPIHLFFDSYGDVFDPIGCQLMALDEDIYAPFLAANPYNQIHIMWCPIRCDCTIKWLFDAPKDWWRRVDAGDQTVGVQCADHRSLYRYSETEFRGCPKTNLLKYFNETTTTLMPTTVWDYITTTSLAPITTTIQSVDPIIVDIKTTTIQPIMTTRHPIVTTTASTTTRKVETTTLSPMVTTIMAEVTTESNKLQTSSASPDLIQTTTNGTIVKITPEVMTTELPIDLTTTSRLDTTTNQSLTTQSHLNKTDVWTQTTTSLPQILDNNLTTTDKPTVSSMATTIKTTTVVLEDTTLKSQINENQSMGSTQATTTTTTESLAVTVINDNSVLNETKLDEIPVRTTTTTAMAVNETTTVVSISETTFKPNVIEVKDTTTTTSPQRPDTTTTTTSQSTTTQEILITTTKQKPIESVTTISSNEDMKIATTIKSNEILVDNMDTTTTTTTSPQRLVTTTTISQPITEKIVLTTNNPVVTGTNDSDVNTMVTTDNPMKSTDELGINQTSSSITKSEPIVTPITSTSLPQRPETTTQEVLITTTVYTKDMSENKTIVGIGSTVDSITESPVMTTKITENQSNLTTTDKPVPPMDTTTQMTTEDMIIKKLNESQSLVLNETTTQSIVVTVINDNSVQNETKLNSITETPVPKTTTITGMAVNETTTVEPIKETTFKPNIIEVKGSDTTTSTTSPQRPDTTTTTTSLPTTQEILLTTITQKPIESVTTVSPEDTKRETTTKSSVIGVDIMATIITGSPPRPDVTTSQLLITTTKQKPIESFTTISSIDDTKSETTIKPNVIGVDNMDTTTTTSASPSRTDTITSQELLITTIKQKDIESITTISPDGLKSDTTINSNIIGVDNRDTTTTTTGSPQRPDTTTSQLLITTTKQKPIESFTTISPNEDMGIGLTTVVTDSPVMSTTRIIKENESEMTTKVVDKSDKISSLITTVFDYITSTVSPITSTTTAKTITTTVPITTTTSRSIETTTPMITTIANELTTDYRLQNNSQLPDTSDQKTDTNIKTTEATTPDMTTKMTVDLTTISRLDTTDNKIINSITTQNDNNITDDVVTQTTTSLPRIVDNSNLKTTNKPMPPIDTTIRTTTVITEDTTITRVNESQSMGSNEITTTESTIAVTINDNSVQNDIKLGSLDTEVPVRTTPTNELAANESTTIRSISETTVKPNAIEVKISDTTTTTSPERPDSTTSLSTTEEILITTIKQKSIESITSISSEDIKSETTIKPNVEEVDNMDTTTTTRSPQRPDTTTTTTETTIKEVLITSTDPKVIESETTILSKDTETDLSPIVTESSVMTTKINENNLLETTVKDIGSDTTTMSSQSMVTTQATTDSLVTDFNDNSLQNETKLGSITETPVHTVTTELAANEITTQTPLSDITIKSNLIEDNISEEISTTSSQSLVQTTTSQPKSQESMITTTEQSILKISDTTVQSISLGSNGNDLMASTTIESAEVLDDKQTSITTPQTVSIDTTAQQTTNEDLMSTTTNQRLFDTKTTDPISKDLEISLTTIVTETPVASTEKITGKDSYLTETTTPLTVMSDNTSPKQPNDDNSEISSTTTDSLVSPTGDSSMTTIWDTVKTTVDLITTISSQLLETTTSQTTTVAEEVAIDNKSETTSLTPIINELVDTKNDSIDTSEQLMTSTIVSTNDLTTTAGSVNNEALIDTTIKDTIIRQTTISSEIIPDNELTTTEKPAIIDTTIRSTNEMIISNDGMITTEDNPSTFDTVITQTTDQTLIETELSDSFTTNDNKLSSNTQTPEITTTDVTIDKIITTQQTTDSDLTTTVANEIPSVTSSQTNDFIDGNEKTMTTTMATDIPPQRSETTTKTIDDKLMTTTNHNNVIEGETTVTTEEDPTISLTTIADKLNDMNSNNTKLVTQMTTTSAEIFTEKIDTTNGNQFKDNLTPIESKPDKIPKDITATSPVTTTGVEDTMVSTQSSHDLISEEMSNEI